MSVWTSLRSLVGRRGVEHDVAEELQAHLLHRVDDLVEQGISPDEARARAEAEFGDVARIRTACTEARLQARRGARIPAALDVLRQDVVFAVRQLRRSPGFAAVAALTLALGIGATTTIVGVVDSVVLAPLPFHDPDRVVVVQETTPRGDRFSVAEPNYLDWRARMTTFQDLAATSERTATWTGEGEPRNLRSAWVSASLLDVLGVEPALGRGIRPEEDGPGARAPVTVLGHDAWIRYFGGDPAVVGRDLVLDGTAHSVIGVLPADVSFLDEADVLVPLGADPATDRDEHYLGVVGRLAPGVPLEAAQQELSALAESLGRTYPVNAGWGARITPARDQFVGPALERAGWMLMAAAALLLLIACVNVSNLMLARASTRRGEVGVRMALGAGRGRIARQLLTESLLLAGAGGAAGLVLTYLAIPAVQELGAGRIPRLDQASVSPVVLLACLGAVVGAAVVFGLAPMLDLRRGRATEALRSARRLDSGGGRGVRAGMVVAQVALSAVLLLGTGLLVRSFVRLAGTDPGFDPDGAMSLTLTMPDRVYDVEARQALVREVLDATRAVPGVVAAGATAVAPFQGMNLSNFTAREDRMPADQRDFLPMAWRIVTPGFFEAMGMDVLAGRDFRDGDGWGDDVTPVIISRTLADKLWPEGDALAGAGPVGSTLVWGDPEGSRLTVVGVVSDLRDIAPGEAPLPIMYRTHQQIPWAVMTVVARVREATPVTATAIRGAVRRAAPGVALPDLRSLREYVREAVAEPRFNVLVLFSFAAAGLLLALVGVYGVTSFAVSRRVREIGIRLALGGDPSDIRRMVLAASLRLAVLGVLVGAAAAWAGSRWIEGLLYETGVHDPVTWVTVPVVLLGAAVAAAYLPARRATLVQPTEALAEE